MSNFFCDICGTELIDGPLGYITECEHYQLDESRELPGYKPDELDEKSLQDLIHAWKSPTNRMDKA